jgi:hypothetical protein
METNNTLTGIELVKELNSKRTQGEWGKIHIVRDNINGYKDFKEVCVRAANNCHLATFGGVDRFYEIETEANAQYTALAVNNFAKVTELLGKAQKVMEEVKIAHPTMFGSEVLNEIRQALNNIKL